MKSFWPDRYLEVKDDDVTTCIFFSRTDHSAERAAKSGDSLRTTGFISHADRAVLHPQPFPSTDVGYCIVPPANRRRSPEAVFSESQRVTRHEVRDAHRCF